MAIPEPVSYKAELVGVFGHPVAENPTIVMQEAAFLALGLNWRYLTIEVRPDQLADAVQSIRALNMRGINLTIPHKVSVIPFLDTLAPEAELVGAVNTVVNENGRLVGHNTDGKGFVRSLAEDADVNPLGKTVVFLGAGGAARAMSVEMALTGAEQIVIVNRNQQRGEALAMLLNERTPASAQYVPWSDQYRVSPQADIFVNATSVGLFPDVDAMPNIDIRSIRPELIVCDVIPNPPQTAFLQTASEQGARTLDGLGMLVGQGAIAFKMWTGLDAPAGVMYQALSNVFSG